jgi:hypothetical protein
MREVGWIEEWPLGKGRAKASGTVADLLTGGPYPSLSPPEVPPLAIVNEILGTRGGGGMNGGRRWRPFALSAGEYSGLVDDLVTNRGFTVVDMPPWVTDRGEWHIWLMERRWGVPAEQQRQLSQQARDLAKQLEEARADPGTPADQLAQIYLAAMRAEDDAAHFHDRWITVPRFSKYCRTCRWHRDAVVRQRAAELAGDMVAAAAAAAEVELVQARCRAIPDGQWPSDWEDWPEYPPQSSAHPAGRISAPASRPPKEA